MIETKKDFLIALAALRLLANSEEYNISSYTKDDSKPFDKAMNQLEELSTEQLIAEARKLGMVK